jgi:hypothetical protein
MPVNEMRHVFLLPRCEKKFEAAPKSAGQSEPSVTYYVERFILCLFNLPT